MTSRFRSSAAAARPGRSVARTVFSVLLWVVAGLTVILGVAGLVDAATGKNASGAAGGLVFVFLIALFSGSAARAVARGGHRTARRPAGPLGPGPAVPGSFMPGPADSGLADSGPGVAERGPASPFPPPDAAVAYRERSSQFPLVGAILAVLLLAASVALLVAAGGPNGRGGAAAGTIGVIVALGSALYLILVAIDLPNGIDITGGQFTVGVHGVPPAGRLWRQFRGPLDAVRAWDVLSLAQVRRFGVERRNRAPAGRRVQYLGDLRLFSRRQYLWLVVDPAMVDAGLPDRIQSGFVFVPAAQAGAVWDGTIVIGTRRGAALAAALDRALPGRPRSGIRSDEH
jgi:hypothetical protein